MTGRPWWRRRRPDLPAPDERRAAGERLRDTIGDEPRIRLATDRAYRLARRNGWGPAVRRAMEQ